MIADWFTLQEDFVENPFNGSLLRTDNKKAVLSQGNRAMPQLFFFGLKFADNIHYKFQSIAKLRSFKLQTYRCKTEINAKWLFKVIQSHVFWSQWNCGKATKQQVIYTIKGDMFVCLFVDRSFSADSKHSADHSQLLRFSHFSAGDMCKQTLQYK